MNLPTHRSAAAPMDSSTVRAQRSRAAARRAAADRAERAELLASIDATAMEILRHMHHDPTNERIEEREPMWVRHCELTNLRDGIE